MGSRPDNRVPDNGPHPRGGYPDLCLTLHQPYASLMVYGLKRVEGRGWSSDYKGPLWIHAASKVPDPADIKDLEALYTDVYRLAVGDDSALPALPPHYPTSALVGRVEVVGCVPAGGFNAADMPPCARLEGESNGSDFFFLCQGQQRMVLPQQLSGQHKLYRIGKKAAQGAATGLKKCEQMPIDFVHWMGIKRPPGPEPVGTGGGSGEGEGGARRGAVSADDDDDDIALQAALALSLQDAS